MEKNIFMCLLEQKKWNAHFMEMLCPFGWKFHWKQGSVNELIETVEHLINYLNFRQGL